MTNEQDIELLNSYLDSALTPLETQSLHERLRAEPELSALLEQLKVQRTDRTSAWQSLEPSEQKVHAFLRDLRSRIDAQQHPYYGLRISRFGSAIAACLVLGFMAGWIGRGKSSQLPAHTNNVASSVAMSSGGGALSGPYQVAVTDDKGQIVAVQNFADFNQARDFANDMGHWEATRRAVESGEATFVSDQF